MNKKLESTLSVVGTCIFLSAIPNLSGYEVATLNETVQHANLEFKTIGMVYFKNGITELSVQYI